MLIYRQLNFLLFAALLLSGALLSSSLLFVPVSAQVSLSTANDNLSQMLSGTSVSNSTTDQVNNPFTESLSLGAPFFVESIKQTSQTMVNQTYAVATLSGNGTLIPPNSDRPSPQISTNDTGKATIAIQPNGYSFIQGIIIIRTADGSDNATVTFYELAYQNNAAGTNVTISGNGTGVAFIKTNSTGQLSFLNNVVGIFRDEFGADHDTVKVWNWSPLPFSSSASLAAQQVPSGPNSAASPSPSLSSNPASQLGNNAPATKQLAIQVNIAKDPIVRGNEQTISVTATDATSNQKIAGVSITATVNYASGSTTKQFSGVTDSSGQYSFHWIIGGNSGPGIFKVHVDALANGYGDVSKSTSFAVKSAS